MAMRKTSSDWIRASAMQHCPVPGCDSDHFCWWRVINHPTAYVLCMKVFDGSFKTSYLSGMAKPAYHHIIDISAGVHGSLQMVAAEPIASPFARHEAYSALLTGYLSSFHRAYLSSRQCTEEMARLFLYTTLPGSYRERDEVAQALNDLGVGLKGVPGFWYDHEGRWHLSGPSGILMPVVSRDGLITGCQINTDEYITAYVRFLLRNLPIPDDQLWRKKMKYVWLSSIPKKKTNEEGKEYIERKTGTGAQASLHYPATKEAGFLNDINLEDQIVIEGVHKANMVAYLTGETVIGQAGASASQPEVARTALGASRLFIAYDSDWMSNPWVRYALTSLIYQIQNLRSLDNVFVLYWPEDAGSGYDDVIFNGATSRVIAIPADEWLREYEITETPE